MPKRKTVVRRARMGKKVKRSRRKNTRMRKNRRQMRTRKTNIKGLVGTAIVGGRDEEDGQVKRHMAKGVVIEYGKSEEFTSTVTGTPNQTYSSLSIVHSTFPTKSVMDAVCASIVKLLFVRMGFMVKNLDGAILPTGLASVAHTLAYDYYNVSGSRSQSTVSFTPGTTTYFGLAQLLAASILSISEAVAQSINKFGKIWIVSASVDQWQASLDMDVCYFKMDLVSNFVYQNRTHADDGSTVATDIDQQPLFEVQSIGKGNGPTSNDGGRDTLVSLYVDRVTGLHTQKHGDNTGAVDKFLTAEPSKRTWMNVTRVKDDIANPGVVKQSKLKSKYTFTMTKFLPYLRQFGGDTEKNKTQLGKFKHMWFRKTIAIGATTALTPVRIAYQHHWAIGVTYKYKENNRTVAFVANENV